MVLAIAFVLALVLSLVLTPVGTRAAWATGYLDHPEARKLHTTATALLGGAVVFVSALLAWSASVKSHAFGMTAEVPFLIGGAAVALGIGMWDDRFGMEPRIKFLGQGVSVSLLLASGHIPDLGLPVVANAAISVFVLISLMNAVNFLDNMNGVVGGLSAIAQLGFSWLSWTRGSYALAAGQLAVAGACLGFLRYNFPKAKIFLGDAGSLFLGYCLGASAVLAYDGTRPGWGRVGPFMMLLYPAFDLLFVVITRRRDGRKVSQGGKDHTNHRLASVLKCQTTTVLLVWLSGVALCVSGLVVVSLNQALPALLLSGLWSSLLIWAGLRLSSVPVTTARGAPN